MNDLLGFAIEAHGGMDRWNQFKNLTAKLSVDGAIWYLKQVPGLLKDKRVELDTHVERIAIRPFGQDDGYSRFQDNRLSFLDSSGNELSGFNDPSAQFAGQTIETPWQPLHVAYFASEALWTYLTSPFLYTYAGFKTREIDPWHENGETWRRLEITFPDHIASHTRTQITCFGLDGLMRRHDYTVDILGGATGANYTTGYRNFQGIMVPTERRIFAYDSERNRVPEPLLVSIDVDQVEFT